MKQLNALLTEESAEKFNSEKRPVTPANLAYLKSFWGKPVIIEPIVIIGSNFYRKNKRA